ncbi:unnamed protein product [Echinostoma caproni]|uniref:Frizzled-4 n=1 Tax=Echinostoma caproni TaxID=27848 RepID=A0A183ABX2_9TREM|nr:unnamed protein product [Echinostoma caproni]
MTLSTTAILFVFLSVTGLSGCNASPADEGQWQPHSTWNFSRDPKALISTKRQTRSNEFDQPKMISLSQGDMPPLILDSDGTHDQASNLFEDDSLNQCVPIHEQICQGLQYTPTVGCSHYLKFFLCTVYFPMCTPQLNSMTTLQPCENLCRYVQSRCEPIMKSFSFPWPKELNCNAFPKSSAMCIQPQNYDLDQQTPHPPSASLLSQGLSGVGRQTIAELIPDLTQLFNSQRQGIQHPEDGDPSDSKTQFSDIWLMVWSVLCALSCALTLITFILDRARFAYPERPIVYISAYTAATQLSSMSGLGSGIPSRESYLIVSGFEGTWCTVVFILLYYFGQASYIWWLMLSVTWFLSAACKWGSEGIETISSVLHMLAWALPALKTMIVLIMHRIDADELTGLCHIGYQDSSSLLFFVLVPQICYLVIGLCFLILGFFSLVSVRSNLNHLTAMQNGNVRRLDKLMAKICIFSILYIIPTICVIGVNIYKYGNFSKWQYTLDRLDQPHGTNWARADLCLEGLQLPSVETNMLQSFMSLVVGITSGMWVWCNRKTFTTWTHCVRAKQPRNGSSKPGVPASVDGRIHTDQMDGRTRRDKAQWTGGRFHFYNA